MTPSKFTGRAGTLEVIRDTLTWLKSTGDRFGGTYHFLSSRLHSHLLADFETGKRLIPEGVNIYEIHGAMIDAMNGRREAAFQSLANHAFAAVYAHELCGDFSAALDCLNQLARENRVLSDCLMHARLALLVGQADQMVDILADSGVPGRLCTLYHGLSLTAGFQFKDATAVFEALSPRSEMTDYCRGMLLRMQGRPDEAIQAFQSEDLFYPNWYNRLQTFLTLIAAERTDATQAAWTELPDHAVLYHGGSYHRKTDSGFKEAAQRFVILERKPYDTLDASQRVEYSAMWYSYLFPVASLDVHTYRAAL